MVKEIREAISRYQFISITYNSASSDSITTREVFPLDLFFKDGIGYLQAVLPTGDELRTFRVDRIINLSAGAIDSEFATRMRTPEAKEQVIEIEMGEDGIFFLEKHNEIVTSFREVEGNLYISLQVSSLEWIKRVICSWPSRIKVIKPLDLAEVVHEITRDTLKNYS